MVDMGSELIRSGGVSSLDQTENCKTGLLDQAKRNDTNRKIHGATHTLLHRCRRLRSAMHATMGGVRVPALFLRLLLLLLLLQAKRCIGICRATVRSRQVRLIGTRGRIRSSGHGRVAAGVRRSLFGCLPAPD